jgi:GNAT superfamily N-acetyltransferase
VEGAGEISISTDPSRLDLDLIRDYLARSYWAKGISRETVERSIAGSLCFGLFEGARQIGFARVITDRATFAYLADVFILEEFRGRGLGKRLMETIRAHPDLRNLRRWMLVTRDAHGLYEKFGFRPLANPERVMEIAEANIYASPEPRSGESGGSRDPTSVR